MVVFHHEITINAIDESVAFWYLSYGVHLNSPNTQGANEMSFLQGNVSNQIKSGALNRSRDFHLHASPVFLGLNRTCGHDTMIVK